MKKNTELRQVQKYAKEWFDTNILEDDAGGYIKRSVFVNYITSNYHDLQLEFSSALQQADDALSDVKDSHKEIRAQIKRLK